MCGGLWVGLGVHWCVFVCVCVCVCQTKRFGVPLLQKIALDTNV
jgi:hypothetical protein